MAFDPHEEYASEWQIAIIESKIAISALPLGERDELEKELFDTSLTQERANEIIDYLKANELPEHWR